MNTNGRVHIGKRIASLRDAHGDSLRQAAARTGVSHTTIGRLETGQATTSLHSTLRKIADGYGVTIEYLLTGRDPKRDFEASIRQLPPEERSRLFFTSPADRIRMVLHFLVTEYASEFPLENLADSLSVPLATLHCLLEGGDGCRLPDDEVRRIGDELSRLTSIPRHWFRSGYYGGEKPELIAPEALSAYAQLIKKAAQAGVRPDVLEMAIDLLILKYNELSSARNHTSSTKVGS